MHVLKKIEYCITRLLKNKFISACKCKYKHFHLKKKPLQKESKLQSSICASVIWIPGLGVWGWATFKVSAL